MLTTFKSLHLDKNKTKLIYYGQGKYQNKAKNIPTPHTTDYINYLIVQTEKLLKRMRWKFSKLF